MSYGERCIYQFVAAIVRKQCGNDCSFIIMKFEADVFCPGSDRSRLIASTPGDGIIRN